jgi:UDP-glucose 4-epimerase
MSVSSLDDVAGLARAFRGASQVVHLAARVHVLRETARDPLAEFRLVNVAGTRSVYRVACGAGAERFVYVSSVKVNGEGGQVPYTEDTLPAPVDPYGQSKLEAERALAEGRVAGGSPVVILRPPLVYGPGVGGNFRQLCRLADAGRFVPLPLGGIRNRRSLIALHNLADVIVRAATHPGAIDRTFLVSDGMDLSTSDLVARLTRALGGSPRLWRCPEALVRRVARWLGRPGVADRLLGSLTVDIGLVRRELGWAPPMSIDEGIEEVARWWQATSRR